MFGPTMAAFAAPPSLSLAAFAPGLAGNHAAGRGAGLGQPHPHAGDSLALSGAAQSVIAGTASDVVAGYLKGAVDQLEADLTKLFLMLGMSRDVAEQMAQSISGALATAFSAAPDASTQLAQMAGAAAQSGPAAVRAWLASP